MGRQKARMITESEDLPVMLIGIAIDVLKPAFNRFNEEIT
jgi:hypothetical protein